MSTEPYDEILSRVRDELTRERQQQLAETLSRELGRKNGGLTHSITDLKGLGKEMWNGVDTEAHIAEERDAWDG